MSHSETPTPEGQQGDGMSPSEAEGLAYVLAQLNLSAIKRGAAARWAVVDESEQPAKAPPKP